MAQNKPNASAPYLKNLCYICSIKLNQPEALETSEYVSLLCITYM